MEEKIKKRDSNFELLRLIAIFIVILGHYNYHGFNSITTDNVNLNYYLIKLFPIGCIANHIFILLTGYFLIKTNIKYKKIINLIVEMFFYSICIYIISVISGISDLNITNIIKACFPIIYGQWFLVYYILLYLIAPFINKFVNSIKQEEYKKLLIILFILFMVIPTFTSNTWNFTKHDYFIFDYLLGGYISIYGLKKFEKTNKKYFCLIFNCIICVLPVVTLINIGSKTNNTSLIMKSSYFIANNYSVFIFMISLSMFLIFKDIKLEYNKIINYLSSSVLAVYLIHDNQFLRNWIWTKFWPNMNYYNSNYLFLHAIAKVMIILTTCIFIDKIRILIFNKFEKIISEKIYKILTKIVKKFRLSK